MSNPPRLAVYHQAPVLENGHAAESTPMTPRIMPLNLLFLKLFWPAPSPPIQLKITTVAVQEGMSKMKIKKTKNDLVDAGCNFWFSDNDRVRTPFPKKIQPELRKNAEAAFMDWVENLTDQDREEVDDDEMVSVFEMLLFSEGLKLVGDKEPDQLITIHYPFLPRVGDAVEDETHGSSVIINREVEQDEEEGNGEAKAQPKEKPLFMKVFLESKATQEKWETRIPIPA
jgi:hypothetical protein